MPKSEQSDSATPNPQTAAAMEQPAEESSNRLPSYVFARTTTAGPTDWSMCSSESLFSIQMGNMSYTREQLNWIDSKEGSNGVIEANAAETMEKESQHKDNVPQDLPHSTSVSRNSDASLKSFAFPIPKVEAESPKEASESPKETPKSPAPNAPKSGGPRKWFGCFSCCSSGS
ncbi:hypothetical protein V6Z12_A11G039300 [Gossypium hirsutum]